MNIKNNELYLLVRKLGSFLVFSQIYKSIESVVPFYGPMDQYLRLF